MYLSVIVLGCYLFMRTRRRQRFLLTHPFTPSYRILLVLVLVSSISLNFSILLVALTWNYQLPFHSPILFYSGSLRSVYLPRLWDTYIYQTSNPISNFKLHQPPSQLVNPHLQSKLISHYLPLFNKFQDVPTLSTSMSQTIIQRGHSWGGYDTNTCNINKRWLKMESIMLLGIIETPGGAQGYNKWKLWLILLVVYIDDREKENNWFATDV